MLNYHNQGIFILGGKGDDQKLVKIIDYYDIQSDSWQSFEPPLGFINQID